MDRGFCIFGDVYKVSYPGVGMTDEVHQIACVEDLVRHLQGEADYQGSVWYRGQSDSSWKLLPGFYRLDSPPSESTLLKRFKQSAAMLLGRSPDCSFDWLFLMQHYGVPTRLLDWSESPLVGLYFAVEDQDQTVDGSIWSLKPSELNRNAGISNDGETFFIPSFEEEELKNYTLENLSQNVRTRLKPLAAIATRNNSRIQAQHGVFTIHHHERTPIEDIGDGSHVARYVIPGERKPHIASQLRLLGITKFQLFPELSSIGDIIRDQIS